MALKIKVIKSKDDNIEIIKNDIIKSCLKANVSPLLFNAGLWIVGANSFDLLIEKLWKQ